MIVANYFSAWVGGCYINSWIQNQLPLDLNNAWGWYWIMVAATYIITLLIEWPFIVFLARGARDVKRKSLSATLKVQTVSYLILFCIYWPISNTSLYTQTQIVPPEKLELPANVTIYYISADDGDIYKRTLAREAPQKIYDLNSDDDQDKLLAKPNPSEQKSEDQLSEWELVARIEKKKQLLSVISSTQAETPTDPLHDASQTFTFENTDRSFGRALIFKSSESKIKWDVFADFWAAGGLVATEISTRKKVKLAYDTPLKSWPIRNPTYLPSDQVLFQLGKDQICIFDPITRKVALLTKGRGAVAVIEDNTLKEN